MTAAAAFSDLRQARAMHLLLPNREFVGKTRNGATHSRPGSYEQLIQIVPTSHLVRKALDSALDSAQACEGMTESGFQGGAVQVGVQFPVEPQSY